MGFEKNIDGYLVELWCDDDGKPQGTVFWPANNSKYNGPLDLVEDEGFLENTYGERHKVPRRTIDKIIDFAENQGFMY